jgi:hypothetical protein
MARSVRHGVYLRHAVCATNEKQRWRAREVKGLEPYRRVLRDGAETGRLSSSSPSIGLHHTGNFPLEPYRRLLCDGADTRTLSSSSSHSASTARATSH